MTASRLVDALSGVQRLSSTFSAAWLEQHGVMPLTRDATGLTVGTWHDTPEPLVLDELRLVHGGPITLQRLDESVLRAAIRRVYAAAGSTAQEVLADLAAARSAGGATVTDTGIAGGALALDDLVHLANEAPVVRLVNLLVLEALDARASDVHLEAFRSGLQVRYRVDGVLQPAPSPPASLAAAVISRIKIMADLDIAERRLPQDGRIRVRLQDRDVDVRVSIAPTLHGESVVLRLLDQERGRRALGAMGMAVETLARFREVLARPYGIVLVTGPTGSGKTTTLYAAVEALRTGREKILTVEDPVEYELPGVPQVPVHEKVGLTFAAALRSLLRQDPDVLLVGEIRDAETAQVATQAALTGHLVLSTLHTNDAPGAITRLLDLGVPPYLVAGTLEAVLAQRLVRMACERCRAVDCALCEHCRGTGYRGRHGVFELLVMDDTLRTLLQQRASADQLRAAALAAGMHTLRDDAERLVAAGITTREEVQRVAPI
jgi:general secretion pathway protein E